MQREVEMLQCAFPGHPMQIAYEDSAAARRFLYEGGQVIGEYDATGALAARHVPGLGLDNLWEIRGRNT